MPTKADYCDILKLNEDCSIQDVYDSFYKLSQAWNPLSHPNNPIAATIYGNIEDAKNKLLLLLSTSAGDITNSKRVCASSHVQDCVKKKSKTKKGNSKFISKFGDVLCRTDFARVIYSFLGCMDMLKMSEISAFHDNFLKSPDMSGLVVKNGIKNEWGDIVNNDHFEFKHKTPHELIGQV